MNLFKKIILSIRNYLFPGACALCNNSLIYSNEILYNLCRNCRGLIVPIQGKKCNICGKPLISENELCVLCRKNENESVMRSYDRLWLLFPYTGKYRKLLTAYKFKKNLCLAEFFAEKIAEIIRENPVLQDAVIVPVPPRPGKIKNTGWDQVDSLVRCLGKHIKNQKVYQCLNRKTSRIQKRLNRNERLENLKGRIYFKRKFSKHLQGKPVLLVDDVITTGSTLEVCSKVLKESGAVKVYGLCLYFD